MRSNYKKIGCYVQQANKRNKDMAIINLQGININKLFMPSVANTVGVDLSKYKIVSKYQFAFNPMHVGRDEMLPISMLDSDKPVIVSPAYVVFEIKDHEKLDPEYLMLWCRRPEFDRNTWFTTDSSVRGGFSWSDFCELELPVPSIEKQREIVREYNTIVTRIKLNEQLNQKLEETAQAIYKHWFVDFEFPMTKEYAVSIGKPDLEGKSYKSNGGEMFFCEVLEQEIPKGWEVKRLNNFVMANPENIRKNEHFSDICYLDTGSITNNKIDSWQHLNLLEDEIPSRAKRKVAHNDIIYSTVRPNLRHYGILKNPPNNAIVSTGFCVLRSKNKLIPAELIYLWISSDKITKYLHSKAETSVSTYPSIKPEDLLAVEIAFPTDDILKTIKKIFIPIFRRSEINNSGYNSMINISLLIQQKMTKVVA